MFLSVDFEDFAHDLRRDLGIWETGPLREDALWRSYETIECFLQDHDGARITFFCTGIVAERVPALVAQMAKDGHEVACHYHYHDEMDRYSAGEAEAHIRQAKDALEHAAGTSVIGFRAPKFKISKSNGAQYQVLARYFTYDSSWFGDSTAAARTFLRCMNAEPLKLFPIFRARPVSYVPNMLMGGSYMKLFPRSWSERLVAQCKSAEMVPHIYLHPYEFVDDGSFRLSRKELNGLGVKDRLYWSLRQHQWNTVGNSGLKGKLAHLIAAESLRGRLDQHLDQAVMVL